MAAAIDPQTATLVEETAPPGSPLYYQIRFSPKRRWQDLALLLTLHRQLLSIPLQCTDAAVAHGKLAWWREELTLGVAGNGRHHLTRQLQQMGIAEHALALLPTCDALVRQIDDECRDWSATDRWLDQRDLALQQQVQRLCDLPPLPEDQLAAALRLIGRCQLINGWAQHRQRNNRMLPVAVRDTLARSATMPETQRAAFYHQADEDMTAATARIGNMDAWSPFLRIGYRIHQRQWREMVQRRLPVARESLALTPLLLLWIAWQNR